MPEEEPTREERIEATAREVIAGHPQGAIRRIILYVILFACLGLAFYVSAFVVPALVAGVLLLATDTL